MLSAQQAFQRAQEQASIRRSIRMEQMSALKNYSSNYTNGSTRLIQHIAELTPYVGRLMESNAPTNDQLIDAVERYDKIAEETLGWLAETGPHLALLEILTGAKGPDQSFQLNMVTPAHLNSHDALTQRNVLTMMQQQLAKLQDDMLKSNKQAIKFMDTIATLLREH